MVCREVIRARGHPNIRATHRSTLEITRDHDLTPRGDCIIGVEADKSAFELSDFFKDCIRSDGSVLIMVIEVEGFRDIILAHGHYLLELSDTRRVIIRKSNYVDRATLGIKASKAAVDIKRELVERLRNREVELTAYLYVFRLDEITSIYPDSRSIFRY